MTTKHKFLLATIVLFSTVLGAAAWFFWVFMPGHAGTSEVLADIDNHWKVLDVDRSSLSVQTSGAEQAAQASHLSKRASVSSSRTRAANRDVPAMDPPAEMLGIVQVDPISYIIPRSLFEAALSSPQAALTGVTASTTTLANGKTRFTVHGIAPTSLLHQAGLRSGDELLRINGYPIDSPEAVFIAYAAVRSAKAYRLDLLRGGRPLSLYFKVN